MDAMLRYRFEVDNEEGRFGIDPATRDRLRKSLDREETAVHFLPVVVTGGGTITRMRESSWTMSTTTTPGFSKTTSRS